jgi:RNA polymerase-binding transcription factor DksA
MINKDEFKLLLLGLQKQAEEKLNKTQQHIHHTGGPVSKSFTEQATERSNDDVVYNLDTLARSELAEIEAALRRVETDTYGLCSKCGNEIEIDRLRALPYTRNCVSCASD